MWGCSADEVAQYATMPGDAASIQLKQGRPAHRGVYNRLRRVMRHNDEERPTQGAPTEAIWSPCIRKRMHYAYSEFVESVIHIADPGDMPRPLSYHRAT